MTEPHPRPAFLDALIADGAPTVTTYREAVESFGAGSQLAMMAFASAVYHALATFPHTGEGIRRALAELEPEVAHTFEQRVRDEAGRLLMEYLDPVAWFERDDEPRAFRVPLMRRVLEGLAWTRMIARWREEDARHFAEMMGSRSYTADEDGER